MIKRNEELNCRKIKTNRKIKSLHIGYDGADFIKSLKRIRKNSTGHYLHVLFWRMLVTS